MRRRQTKQEAPRVATQSNTLLISEGTDSVAIDQIGPLQKEQHLESDSTQSKTTASGIINGFLKRPCHIIFVSLANGPFTVANTHQIA